MDRSQARLQYESISAVVSNARVRGRHERGGSPQMIRADAFFLSDGPLYLDWTLSDVDLD